MFRLAFYPWKISVRVTFSKALSLEHAEAGLQTPFTVTNSALGRRNTVKYGKMDNYITQASKESKKCAAD
jgi:hypothetical protein